MTQLPSIEDFEGLSYRNAAFMRGEVADMIAAAVSAEREACAVIVEKHLYLPEHGYMETREDMTDELAAAIRARGEKAK